MSNETIEVGYRNIGTAGGVDYFHKFLLYTDSSGRQYTISGWTDPNNITEKLPFGNIRVYANTPFDANNPDSPVMHPGQQQHRETIAEGADLSATWAAMVENANGKDNRFPYDPIRQNSNTLADSVLRDVGLREPTQDGVFGHLAPGSGKPLDESVVPRSADDLGLSNIGEAISLNNQQADPTELRFALAPDSQQLLKDSEQHVRALADRHQLAWNQGMDNTVHAVALEAREQGLTGITHFNVKDGRIRFAQQDGFGLREGQVGARTAANTPAADSLTQMASADQRELASAQAQPEPQIADARMRETPVMTI